LLRIAGLKEMDVISGEELLRQRRAKVASAAIAGAATQAKASAPNTARRGMWHPRANNPRMAG